MWKLSLNEANQIFGEQSEKLSNIVRQLVFAGFALVWLFSSKEGASVKIPFPLITAAICFVITVFLEIFQYLSGTIIYHFLRNKVSKDCKSEDKEKDKVLEVSDGWNWLSHIPNYLKVASLIVGYIYVLNFFWCTALAASLALPNGK